MIARYTAILTLSLAVACSATSTSSPESQETPSAIEAVSETPEDPQGADAVSQVTPAEPGGEPDVRAVEKPEPVVIEVDWAAVPEGAAWTRFTAKAIDELGTGLIAASPGDVAPFCPKYEMLNAESKRAFWVSLISAMARPESNFDPAASFNEYDNCNYPGCKEDFTTQDGRKVVSRGLLQLSQESANGYKRFGCEIAIEDEETLHDPETNLRCAVVILARWVSADGVIAKETSPWRGGARYWSVLRRPDKIAEIQKFTANTPYCVAD